MRVFADNITACCRVTCSRVYNSFYIICRPSFIVTCLLSICLCAIQFHPVAFLSPLSAPYDETSYHEDQTVPSLPIAGLARGTTTLVLYHQIEESLVTHYLLTCSRILN